MLYQFTAKVKSLFNLTTFIMFIQKQSQKKETTLLAVSSIFLSLFPFFSKPANGSRSSNLYIVAEHQRRSLFDSKGSCYLWTLFGQNLSVFETCLIQITARDPAIRTGCSGKQDRLVTVPLDFNRFSIHGAFLLFCLRIHFKCPVFSFIVKDVFASFLILLCFAGIPVLHRTVIPCDSAIYLGSLPADWASEVLPCQVSMTLAHRVCRRHRVIWEAIVLGNLSNQICRGLPGWQFFSQESMEYRTGSILGLELILNIQRSENIIREANR